MTNADPLPPTVLSHKAVVYVRQSTQSQVRVHLESQRRQYDLVDEARRHGFRDVEPHIPFSLKSLSSPWTGTISSGSMQIIPPP